MKCAKCRAPLAAHFKIEHVSGNGTVTTSAAVCSLTCLLGWGQDYAAAAGMHIVMGVQQKITAAKNLFGAIKDALKGPPR